MSQEQKIYRYLLRGEGESLNALADFASSLDGVSTTELDGETGILTVSLTDAASEYDVFTALYSAGEEMGVEVDYADIFDAPEEQADEAEELPPEIEEDEADEGDKPKADEQLPEEEKPWKKKYLANLIELGVSALLMLIVLIFDLTGNTRSFMCLIAFTFVGYEIVLDAFSSIMRKNIFTPSLVMIVASVVCMFAFDYLEAAFVAWLFECQILLGKILADRKEEKLKARLYFDYSEIQTEDGVVFAKDYPENSCANFAIGEVVPFDGIIEEGSAKIDYYNVTGVHKYEQVGEGAEVFGGGSVVDGEVKVRSQKSVKDSLAGVLYSQVSGKQNSAEKTVKVNRKCRASVVVTLAISLVIAFVLPLIFKESSYSVELKKWGYIAVAFFALSNALVFAAFEEIIYKSAVYRALSMGAYVNSAQKFSQLAGCKTAVFVQPGALTESELGLNKVVAMPGHKGEVLKTVKAFGLTAEALAGQPVTEVSKNGKTLICGELSALKEKGIAVKKSSLTNTVIYVVLDGVVLGAMSFSPQLKENSFGALSELNANGVNSTVLTGESEDEIQELAELCTVKGGLTDERKRAVIEKLAESGDEALCVGSKSQCGGAELQIVFGDTRETVGDNLVATVPSGDVKAVAKLVTLSKKIKSKAKLTAVLPFAVKAISFILFTALMLSGSGEFLWIAVLLDAISTVGCMINGASITEL